MTSSSRAILEFGNSTVNAFLGFQDQLLFVDKKRSTIFVSFRVLFLLLLAICWLLFNEINKIHSYVKRVIYA